MNYEVWASGFRQPAMEKLKRHKWSSVIGPVVYARDYDADLWSKQCRSRRDGESRVNFQHHLGRGGNSAGGNESLQSSRLMLLILMWSHANLTIILWDILSQGQTLSGWEFPGWPCRNKRSQAGGIFSGNCCVNIYLSRYCVSSTILIRQLQQSELHLCTWHVTQ